MAVVYKVVKGSFKSKATTESFEREVNSLLRSGWELHGRLVASQLFLIQTMIKNVLTTRELDRIFR